MNQTSLSELSELLKSSTKIIFLCIGNELRGDDYFGIYLGKKLKRTLVREKVVLSYSTPEDYIEEIVVFVDAVHANLERGTIVLREMSMESPLNMEVSTHSISLETLTAMIAFVCSKKPRFFLLGVQIGHLEFGEKMSKEVVKASKILLKFFKDRQF
jgi:hydrogenase 3 maturation protease